MMHGDDAYACRPRLLQAALNGNREHPAAPRTPKELAAEARAAIEAGAVSLHLHPYDREGSETLAATPCAAALRAVRAACPGTPISLSTSAAIEPDPERRLALVDAWAELPDFVTANQGEEGILALCERLLARGVGIESGLLSLEDARPSDYRPRRAIEFARAWARGEMAMTQARTADFAANAAAREVSGAAKQAALAAGQARAVAHVPAHELGAAAYAIRAAGAAAPEGERGRAGRLECRWQRAQLPSEIRELVLDDQRLRNEVCWYVFDC